MSGYGSLGVFVLAVDAAIVCASYYLGFLFRFGSRIPTINLQSFTESIPYIALFALLLFWFFQLHLSTRKHTFETLYNIGLSVAFLNFGTMAITYINRQFAFPRSVFIVSSVIQFVFLAVWHVSLAALAQSRQKVKDTVIISTKGDGWHLANRLTAYSGKKYRVVRACSASTASNAISSIDTAQAVFMDHSVPPAIKDEVIAHCLTMDKQAVIVPSVYDIVLRKSRVSTIDDLPVFEIENLPLTPSQQVTKRICDIALSAVLLLITMPLFLIVSIAIKISSPGSVFYRQKRMGLGNQSFDVIKFRTMIDGAESGTGPVLASQHDPRVTRVGRLLRPTRLDELPQLLNILKGDMSFVGPRPERPYFVDQFSSIIPGYAYRSKVRPGLTGLAQVSGKYTTDPEAKLRFDLYYIRNYSFILDVQLILQTIRVVLTPISARGTADATQVAAGHASSRDSLV
jgi:exopolysaccharide biosynthesis polyprenyl glycosylphosphotransferase